MGDSASAARTLCSWPPTSVANTVARPWLSASAAPTLRSAPFAWRIGTLSKDNAKSAQFGFPTAQNVKTVLSANCAKWDFSSMDRASALCVLKYRNVRTALIMPVLNAILGFILMIMLSVSHALIRLVFAKSAHLPKTAVDVLTVHS